LEGDVTLDKFTDERVRDLQIIDLMGKVNANMVRSLKFGAKVKVRMKDGKEYEKFRPKPKGSPENPLTFEELENKFKSTAKFVLDSERQDLLIKRIRSLENLDNMTDLMGLV
jgi:2-methylcitrate dehydratase PrpD